MQNPSTQLSPLFIILHKANIFRSTLKDCRTYALICLIIQRTGRGLAFGIKSKINGLKITPPKQYRSIKAAKRIKVRQPHPFAYSVCYLLPYLYGAN